MDSFEAVVEALLQREGYWTQTSVKVNLTKAEKRAIGQPSTPRPELDVVGYKPIANEIVVMECKSFLDSPGVRVSAFFGTAPNEVRRYRLFLDKKLRRVVLHRMIKQFLQLGLCIPGVSVQLGLAAGKIHGNERQLSAHFRRRGWLLWGPQDIREKLRQLRESPYEDSVTTIAVKLLLRGGMAGN